MYLNVPGAIDFIALFGMAVLNGLVLVSTTNKCLAEVNDNPENRYSKVLFRQAIIHGAELRLRPVLMISATFLTLVVLPVIYSWVHSPKKRFPVESSGELMPSDPAFEATLSHS